MIYKALKPGYPGDHLWVYATAEMNGNTRPAQPRYPVSALRRCSPSQAADIHQPSGHLMHVNERWWKLACGLQCGVWTVVAFWVDIKQNVEE